MKLSRGAGLPQCVLGLSRGGRGGSTLARAMLALACALALGCAKSREQWESDLADEDPFARYLAALALAEGEGEPPARAFAVLVRVAQDGDPRSRRAAERAIQSHVRGAAMAYVDAMLEQRTTPTQDTSRAKAGLKSLGDAAVDAIAMEILRPRSVGRQEVWNLLASLGERGRTTVMALFSRESVHVRVGAATALGNLGPQAVEAIPLLLNGLADSNPHVVLVCVGALASIDPSADEVRRQLGCTGSDEDELAEPCARVLLVVARNVVNGYPATRPSLLEFLRKIAGSAERVAIALTLRVTPATQRDTRRFLVHMIYEAPSESLLAALASDPRCAGFEEGLGMPSPARRALSALSLAQAGLRGLPAIDALVRARKDAVPAVQFTARCALLRMAIELGFFAPFKGVRIQSATERAR